MGVADDFRAIVGRMRAWGFKVVEYSGCYGRSNGTSWANGRPVGHVNHHYVCSLNPSASYIESLVSQLANGNTVNWFADVNGCAWLLGTGPMNHAGKGSSSVLGRVRNDQAPLGPAAMVGVPNDLSSGNQNYCGTEGQHPGDGTPWPPKLLDVMVAINAAEFLQWNYTPNRAIHHYEHTDRKIDMSWLGGPNSREGGNQLRSRVAARMGTAGVLPPSPGTGGDWLEMASEAELRKLIREELKTFWEDPKGTKYPYTDANTGAVTDREQSKRATLQDTAVQASRIMRKLSV